MDDYTMTVDEAKKECNGPVAVGQFLCYWLSADKKECVLLALENTKMDAFNAALIEAKREKMVIQEGDEFAAYRIVANPRTAFATQPNYENQK